MIAGIVKIIEDYFKSSLKKTNFLSTLNQKLYLTLNRQKPVYLVRVNSGQTCGFLDVTIKNCNKNWQNKYR